MRVLLQNEGTIPRHTRSLSRIINRSPVDEGHARGSVKPVLSATVPARLLGFAGETRDMPDFFAILTLYQLRASASASGALEAEAKDVTSNALTRVATAFLSGEETSGWDHLSDEARAARLRMGQQRFHRWEAMNPDISALLRRKARSAALG